MEFDQHGKTDIDKAIQIIKEFLDGTRGNNSTIIAHKTVFYAYT